MRKELGILGGLGLGAGLVYLLDPHRGKRRRAVARDKAKHIWRVSEKAVKKTSRDLGNRARGLVAAVKPAGTKEVSDEVLADRVRSAMGHAVSTSGAIQVTANQGKVTLVGSVLKKELPGLLAKVSSVRNVSEVLNRLSVQDTNPAKRRWLKPLLWTAGSALAVLGGSHPATRGRMRRILGT